jgi:AraC-like DNA-binding protein
MPVVPPSVNFEARAVDLASVLVAFDRLTKTMVWIKDPDGRFVWANEPFLLNFSLTHLDRLIGLRDCDMVPLYLAEQYHQDDNAVLAGTPVIGRIEPVSGFERMLNWQRTTKLPLRDHHGRITGIIGMTQPLPHARAPEFPVPEFLPLFEHCHRHPHATLSNHEMAALSGLSVRAFERKFSATFQVTPTQFFKRLRLTRAAEMLLQTNTPIAQVASEWGYSDQSHLNREFRHYFGSTPARYRAASQRGIESTGLQRPPRQRA